MILEKLLSIKKFLLVLSGVLQPNKHTISSLSNLDNKAFLDSKSSRNRIDFDIRNFVDSKFSMCSRSQNDFDKRTFSRFIRNETSSYNSHAICE